MQAGWHRSVVTDAVLVDEASQVDAIGGGDRNRFVWSSVQELGGLLCLLRTLCLYAGLRPLNLDDDLFRVEIAAIPNVPDRTVRQIADHGNTNGNQHHHHDGDRCCHCLSRFSYVAFVFSRCLILSLPFN